MPNLFFLFPIYYFHLCLPFIFLIVEPNIKGYNVLEVGKFTIVDEKATLLNGQIKISDWLELTVQRKARLVKKIADIFDWNFSHISPT